jgi:triosephosphate isomerase
MSRKYVIGGNWKCNGTVAQADSLIAMLNGAGALPANAEVVVAVPSLHLRHAKAALRTEIHTSAQDVSAASGYGAYTGELSGALLKDAGIEWALAGHSERRVGFGGQSVSVIASRNGN